VSGSLDVDKLDYLARERLDVRRAYGVIDLDGCSRR